MTWAYSTFSSARMVSMLISGLLFTFRSARLERYSFSISCDRLSRAAASSIVAARSVLGLRHRYRNQLLPVHPDGPRNSGLASGRKCKRLPPPRSCFAIYVTLGVAQ
uniref:Putative secreted protein n=1 Tax=Anopheles darlingi TaxID=43151 RepID=A0A2M4DFR3_ANODA